MPLNNTTLSANKVCETPPTTVGGIPSSADTSPNTLITKIPKPVEVPPNTCLLIVEQDLIQAIKEKAKGKVKGMTASGVIFWLIHKYLDSEGAKP